MSRPFFHSPPTLWSELYKDWLALAEIHRKENACRTQTHHSTALESPSLDSAKHEKLL